MSYARSLPGAEGAGSSRSVKKASLTAPTMTSSGSGASRLGLSPSSSFVSPSFASTSASDRVAGTAADSAYAQDHRAVLDALRDVQGHTAEIRRQTGILVTSEAVEGSRLKASEAWRAASVIAESARKRLDGETIHGAGLSPNEQMTRKTTQQKLREDLADACMALETAHKVHEEVATARQQELSAVLEARSAGSLGQSRTTGSSRRNYRPDHASEAAAGGDNWADTDVEAALQLKMARERRVAEAAEETAMRTQGEHIEEFAGEIVAVHRNVAKTASLVGQLAGYVRDQGHVLDTIEANMGQTADYTEGAAAQLLQADQRHHKGSRWLCCFLVLAVLVAGTILLLVMQKSDSSRH